MKLGFRKPSPNAYMMLLNGLAFRERVIPIPGDFDPRDPVAVRAAYERDCTGPANGPTGGYFQMLLYLANVEGRMGYAPGALTNEAKFEELVGHYWEARCRHGVVTSSPDIESETAPAPAPGC
ncbi:hypothetical protein [Methylorubrum extorquens]|jgi:hypothetical protein|uniref:Uncharacterized protein n=2 Tax=Methylorubrum extorquens TaxID=408 RepID=C5B4B3_METEA|nr:hypothetical protein [Methylorubrum extorquens]ACS43295.1 Hypothetical protein MexAM1_META2p0443 [Methylorubrum extorquens AM1]EHP94502.1 hypothetical protein MetexDRAFT_0583 [Methylorubrum extorquens DSM 13060]MCP1545611.1 hypothetical protein [Methylorubrum extorquens]MCP1591562.1 hypothetical protein [Methylorubrum extorquens]